jgi:hypothetical protein
VHKEENTGFGGGNFQEEGLKPCRPFLLGGRELLVLGLHFPQDYYPRVFLGTLISLIHIHIPSPKGHLLGPPEETDSCSSPVPSVINHGFYLDIAT